MRRGQGLAEEGEAWGLEGEARLEATEWASLVGSDGTRNRALEGTGGRGGSWGRGGIEVQLVSLGPCARLRRGVFECK